MTRKMKLGSVLSVFALTMLVGCSSASKPAGPPPEMKLPPGWTEKDMQTMMEASQPGKMHQELAKGAGKWKGKSKMWMYGDDKPTETACTVTITPMMDGRYQKVDWEGDMQAMGQFNGMGIQGYDNAIGKFVTTWIDNWGTGIMTGTGDLSADGKTMTWEMNYNCPLTKKPTPMRQIETITGPKTRTLVMFGQDPKSGKEFKMMEVEMTRK